MPAVIIYITTSSTDEARKIGTRLLEMRLVACVNIIAAMHAMFWWKDSISEAKETILLAKSTKNNVTLITQVVQEMHSYDTPCIVSSDITDGSPEFIQWIQDQCVE